MLVCRQLNKDQFRREDTMVRQDNMVMMSAVEYEELAQMKKEVEELRSALLAATRNRESQTGDVLVSMNTFYNLAMSATSDDDGMEEDIYGHDITVHFHGLYCNCQDGAIPYNNIIEGVKGCAEEWDM